MKKKLLALSFMVLLTVLPFALNGQGAVQANSDFASDMEMHIPLTSLTAYSEDFKPNDWIITGNNLDLSFAPGLTLIEDYTELDLGKSSFESDDFIIRDGVRFYDRTAYSPTFLNSSFGTGTVTGGGTQATIDQEWVISSRETSGSGQITGGNQTGTVSWDANLGYDSNDDGDYVDASDESYLPMEALTDPWLYVQINVDHNASSNAGTYGAINLIFDRNTGTDYTVSIRSFQGAGDSGWSGVGGSADDGAVFNAYDADGIDLSLSIPLGSLYIEDSSELGDIIGLDIIRIFSNIAAANDGMNITSANIAAYTNQPAVTDRIDNDDDFDYNDAGNIASGVHDSDSDFLYTKITEGGTEAYDSLLALNKDIQNSITLLHNARKLVFSGVAIIKPYGTSSSVPYTGTSYYQTTESATFDTRWINDNTFESFANVFVWGDVKMNVTIDNDVLQFDRNYEENLVKWYLPSQLDKTDDFKGAWDDTDVQGTSTPFSEVQYDIATPIGGLELYQMIYFTEGAYNFAVSGGITVGDEVAPEAPIIIADIGADPWAWAISLGTGLANGDVNSWVTLIAIIVVAVVFFWAIKKFVFKR